MTQTKLAIIGGSGLYEIEGLQDAEWVSIDIRYIEEVSEAGVYIEGWIYHDCVPEPTTLGLFVLGGFAFIRRRK